MLICCNDDMTLLMAQRIMKLQSIAQTIEQPYVGINKDNLFPFNLSRIFVIAFGL
jgi:hypothetical protein